MYSRHVFLTVGVVFAMLAATYDLRTHRIPNWLNALGLFGGIALHAILGYRVAGSDFAFRAVSGSLVSIAVLGVVPLVLWRIGAFGGGDVKAIIALGAICHVSLGMSIVFAAFSLVGVFAIVKLAWEGQLLRSLFRKGAAGREPVRFGPALAASAIGVALVHGGI